MAARQTFGGAPGPSGFSDISTPTADLANGLARTEEWDETLLRSSYSDRIGEPIIQDDSVPFAEAMPMQVAPEADGKATTNNFVDDLITTFVMEYEQDADRAIQSVLVAFETICRPLIEEEKISREDVMSLSKLLAEGTPTEVLMILGWIVDTRNLEVQLPEDKIKLWLFDLDMMIENKMTFKKQIESVIGRLNHVGNIIPMSRHFLSRLRVVEAHCKKYRYRRLSATELHDLRWWRLILQIAGRGVSMNLLTLRAPNQVVLSDACPRGISGFSLNSGRAWRFMIPPHLIGRRSNNFLEFLGNVISVLVEIYEGRVSPGDCFLSMGDNTAAMGWLMLSNFTAEDKVAHAGLARYFASTLMANGLCCYSQWWMGSLNEVTDTGSREHIMSDPMLTLYIHNKYPEQIPNSFKISQLPDEIISVLCFWLQIETLPKEFNPALTANSTGIGLDGLTSSHAVDWDPTPSCADGASWLSNDCLLRSEKQQGSNITASPEGRLMTHYMLTQLRPPSTLWQRPSATQDSTIHG